jgi:cytochrome c-type biogenesis protein CcmH/NrfF
MTIGIAVVVGAVAILVLVAIVWGTVHRRRRSRPAVEMDDERRQVLRSIAASDYRPKRQARKDL